MSNELQHPVREPIANELIHAVVVITVVAATGKVISYTFEQDADFQKWVIAGLSVLVIGLSYVALRCYKRIWKDSREIAALQSLEKWRKLEEITGLIGFSPQLKNSIYHPKALLARDNIMNLKILGNGCSKWTTSSPTDLRNAAHQCSSGRGKMQFLLQSPTILNARSEKSFKKKAIANAKSAIALRALQNEYPDAVQIREYWHSAELRVTIINDNEVTVGNYSAGAAGDSNDTPLLNFKDQHENRWSFAMAFKQHFESEWENAAPISNWEKIEEIAKGAFA